MLVTVVSETTLTPAQPDGGTVDFSPYDHLNRGRSTPMLWLYERSLEPSKLVALVEPTNRTATPQPHHPIAAPSPWKAQHAHDVTLLPTRAVVRTGATPTPLRSATVWSGACIRCLLHYYLLSSRRLAL